MKITELMIDRAAHAIRECMENDGWVPTFGVRKELLPRLIRTAAQKALVDALYENTVES